MKVTRGTGKIIPANKIEMDPKGLKQNDPGAKLDAGKTEVGLIFNDMPRALLAVAEIGTYGRHKYSKGGWIQVEDGVERYTNAMDRHRLRESIENVDRETEMLHAAHLAWNALARLELIIREQESDEV